MAALNWAERFPLVSVPSGAVKPVTVVMPYYDNPTFIRRQVGWWQTFPAWLRGHLSAIVVDDGSPETPVGEALAGLERPFPIRLFRIEQDVRWNWLAARNIGMHHADGWCLLTDVDHVMPQPTAEALVHGTHDPSVIYGLSRMEHTGEALQAHKNSWFLTRERFWAVGGYDERLSGYYGTDGLWRRRIADAVPLRILTDRLVRHEHIEDSSTRRYKRKQPEDGIVKAIVAGFPPGSKPKTLSFKYHEVTA